MILDYVLKFYLQECLNILCEQDCKGFYSLNIDFMKLFETHPDIGDQVLCSPVETISLCDKDLLKAQQTILEGDEYKTQVEKLGYSSLKRNVHARFFSLPVCPELHRTIFPKNVDLGCFLKLTGTVVRVTQAKMLEFYRSYICVKCKYENTLQGDFEHRYILKAPTKCANEETRCKSTNFTPVNLVSRDHCKDYQEIKIQEQVNKLSIGTIPGSMWVVLEDDLVDSCKPGDDVNICGTVRRRWRPATANKKSEVELVLQANYLEVCNAQRSTIIATAPDIKDCFDEYWAKFEGCPLKGRDRILASVCPQVYGLHLVKLALLLTVITGSNHIVENEAEKKCSQDEKQTRVRGQCHLLLVGDPGTGKSQLLRAGADLTPRSVFTSGAGSTRAGLTCSALREDGEWQLEAGALVLSDGGVCCIDEIGQLREHDRTSIHEAMEQQTISIAKAGIVCKLNTRCAVIAACNPKGHYQTEEPLSVNVSLGTPLLSRFDLIFILLDSKNKAWDKLVSSYILFGGSNATDSKKQWSLEKLQVYIGLVGPRYTEMTKSANIILQTYYMAQRKSNYRDPSRTTVRMLDSLVRLSQAHCRLMYRTMILPVDAIVAVSLIDLSMQDCTLNDTVDALHSTFPKYPDFDYLCTAKKLLAKLGLQKIWKEELLYYGRILQVDSVSLESEIETESYQLFAKFDDVTDDNIQLSSTLITSSYFKHSKKSDELSQQNQEKATDRETNEKLAATLKKHATFNKSIKKAPIEPKTKNKRKRKEVLIDTSLLSNKKAKNLKKTKGKQHTKDSSDSEVETNDLVDMLKAVPSVYDIFNEINIDMNFSNNYGYQDSNDNLCENQTDNEGHLNKKPREPKLDSETTSEKETATKSCNQISNENSDPKLTEPSEPKSTIRSKLNKFKFIEKSKKPEETEVAKLKPDTKTKSVESADSNTSSKKLSVPSSQISIFETSDCDIELDF